MWKSSTLNTKALVKHCNFVYQSSFISLQYIYVCFKGKLWFCPKEPFDPVIYIYFKTSHNEESLSVKWKKKSTPNHCVETKTERHIDWER